MKAITIELPEDVLAWLPAAPEALGQELRLAAAIRWLQQGRVSPGEAAAIAGLGRPEFDAAFAQGEIDIALVRGDAAPAARSIREEEAEAHYHALGNWKRPEAQRRAAETYWKASGREGALWLVRRLRDEWHVETLHWASAMLAEIGEPSLGPIIEGLGHGPPVDQATALLHALGAMGRSFRSHDPGVELTITEFVFHEDPEVRDAAFTALRILGPERAALWLSRRLRDEPDEEVKRTIECKLRSLSGGRE